MLLGLPPPGSPGLDVGQGFGLVRVERLYAPVRKTEMRRGSVPWGKGA